MNTIKQYNENISSLRAMLWADVYASVQKRDPLRIVDNTSAANIADKALSDFDSRFPKETEE